MRICFLGYYGPPMGGDMGTKGAASRLARAMASRHDVLTLSIDKPLSWRRIGGFKPDVLHFVLGPASIRGFLVMKALSVRFPGARVVLSATLPLLSWRPLIRVLKPDLVLVQSLRAEREFQGLGCRTAFLPNGVDEALFRPVAPGVKARLRDRLALARDRFVILYAGPLMRARNIELLGRLAAEDTQVVLAGRSPADPEACRMLEDKGCVVWHRHFENMPDLYAMADCFVFPVPPANLPVCVETPLSVLEAMACNLYVVSTRFGALPRLFDDGGGFSFAGGDEELVLRVSEAKRGRSASRTREMVLPYSWDRIAERLDAIYDEELS